MGIRFLSVFWSALGLILALPTITSATGGTAPSEPIDPRHVLGHWHIQEAAGDVCYLIIKPRGRASVFWSGDVGQIEQGTWETRAAREILLTWSSGYRDVVLFTGNNSIERRTFPPGSSLDAPPLMVARGERLDRSLVGSLAADPPQTPRATEPDPLPRREPPSVDPGTVLRNPYIGYWEAAQPGGTSLMGLREVRDRFFLNLERNGQTTAVWRRWRDSDPVGAGRWEFSEGVIHIQWPNGHRDRIRRKSDGTYELASWQPGRAPGANPDSVTAIRQISATEASGIFDAGRTQLVTLDDFIGFWRVEERRAEARPHLEIERWGNAYRFSDPSDRSAGRVRGTWSLTGNRMVIQWTDQSRDVIELADRGFRQARYEPGSALTDPPASTVAVRRVTQAEIAMAEAASLARERAEAETRRQRELEARLRAEAEARRAAEQEARLLAAEEARLRAEAEARALELREAEARRMAEENARRVAEEEARQLALEESKRREAIAEAARRRAQEEAEARRLAEAEARRLAVEEARQLAEAAEARRQAEREAEALAQAARQEIGPPVPPTDRVGPTPEEVRAQELAQLETARKVEEERRLAERQRQQAEAEAARLRAESEARQRAMAAEEARLREEAEAVAKRRAEVEAEARRLAQEEARQAEAKARIERERATALARAESERRARLAAEAKARPRSFTGVQPVASAAPSMRDLVWSLFIEDSFDGDSLNPEFWSAGFPQESTPNNELSGYSADYVRVRDGRLVITARDREIQYAGRTLPYTSGAVTSFNKFEQAYGYFEIRCKVSEGVGLWPAFWMFSRDNAAIRVMDVFGSEPDRVYQTLISDDGTGTPAQSTFNLKEYDFSWDWQTVGVMWTPSAIAFHLNGREVGRVTENLPESPMALVLSLAVGGDGAGPPDGWTPFPAYFTVDYVRVFRLAE